ncbi:MAG TPA: MG2 domain-containing protein [Bacteroidales bacterium]|nr:MG2 domain-containing protein [Bacteroidales bacterium]
MQPHKLLLISALTTILLVMGSGQAGNKSDETYDQLWEQAQRLNEKQLPQSALQVIDRLYNKAAAEANHQQMLRALIFSFSLRQSFENGALKKAIIQTRQLADQAASPVKEIAHSILAEMYWFHYRNNRHSIMDQSAVAGQTSDDPDDWDPTRYRDVMLHHYQQSLRNQALLESLPISDWQLLLEKSAETSLDLQPTLFDFLAGRYLNFLSQSDASLQARLPLNEALPANLWLPATLFTTLDIPKQDHETLLRIRLLQRILTSNIRLGNTFALIHNELQRFRWLHDLTKNDKAYWEALNTLQNQYAAHAASAEVAADKAEFLQGRTSMEGIAMPLAEALRICDEAIDKYPESRGAQRCKAIRADILRKELSLGIQRTEYPGKPIAVSLNYRNLTRPAFRIVPISSKALTQIVQDFDHERRMSALLELKAIAQWELELPFEPDYAAHSTIIALPALKSGLYVLLASENNSFQPGNLIVYTSFSVSRMSYIQVNRQGTNHFVLLDRQKGTPVGGARVRASIREYDYSQQKTIEKTVLELVTPKNGQFIIGHEQSLPKNRSFYLEISQDGDTLMSDNYFDVFRITEPQRSQFRTWFFTDRAIYRPGQPIYFKGITLVKAPDKPWEPQQKSRTTVKLFDVNGRETASAELTTNDFGSFEGSFLLPANLLTGSFRLSNEHGMTFVQVEEYKRPTFEVLIQQPALQLLLGDEVKLNASARAFAGFPIDGAKVEYRVERQRYLPWFPWWRPFPPSDTRRLIGQGSTTTSADGSFDIRFNALPDYTTPQDEEQYFDFYVTVWVTDRNGETRQASASLRIGNRSLLISSNLPQSINRRKTGQLQVNLSTLQGQPAMAQTVFNYYRIEPGKQPIRPAIFGIPDRKILDDNALKNLFPNDDFYAGNSPDSLKKTLIFTAQALVNNKTAALPESVLQWPEGDYLAEYISNDAAGRQVKLQQRFTLYDPGTRRKPSNDIFWVKTEADSYQLGDTLNLMMASSLRGMRVLVEVSSADKVFRRSWINIGSRKQFLKLPLDAGHVGSLSVQVSGVALNRFFHQVFDFQVANPQDKLDLRLETVAERLQPGRPEQWTIRITGPDRKPVKAELMAAMYDASLEQFKGHKWFFDPQPPKPFAQRWMSDNGFGTYDSWTLNYPVGPELHISSLQPPMLNWYGFEAYPVYFGGLPMKGLRRSAPPGVDMSKVLEVNDSENPGQVPDATAVATAIAEPARNLRSDFRETAFFYPILMPDSLGRVSLRFTPPDALTRWRLMLLANTPQLQHAQLVQDFEASKPLLVVPNLARFYRSGDTAVMAVKVVNTGNETLDGMAMLELTDALTALTAGKMEDAARKPFVQLRPGQSAELRWRVVLSDAAALLRIRISASAGTFTDAEEHLVPLLPSGLRLTETMPLFVKGNSNAGFTIPGLDKTSAGREQNIRLKLELTTHPAWVAVKALPYVVDAGYENTDNVFRRFYTNTLAAHVASSVPGFEAVLASWNRPGSNALSSELQKNEDVKMLALQQTPWLAEAENEAAQRQRLILFFDPNRLKWEQQQSLEKLEKSQLPDGSWPWFPGMRGNLWITLNIVEGLGKLQMLDPGIARNPALEKMLQRALPYIDRQAAELYARRKEGESLGSMHVQLLSTRSYFSGYQPGEEAAKAYTHFNQLLEKDWTRLSISDQARAALHLHRIGNLKLALQITASLRERAVRSDKLGIWWKAGRAGDEAMSVEGHAMLVQLFELVASDRATADGIRQYLLTQKQTRRWVSGTATAEAVFALLMYGTDWISSGKPVEVTMGGKPLDISKAEAGTGNFAAEWFSGDITPALSRVNIVNPNPGMVWGGIYRQYEVPIDAVRQHSNEVRLDREILVERTGASGVIFEPLRIQKLRQGDRIRVRLTLETSRDLEFIHLSDLRSPAFEPLEVLSGYQYRSGLGFYQSTRDASTDFFFDLLPRGKHVFEYSLVVMHSGHYSGGFARMQSYYAPAFAAHSSGIRITAD